MPSEKSARSSRRKASQNRANKSTMRTSLSKAQRLVEVGELPQAEAATAQAIRTLDRAARKGIIHPNQAAHKKSRLMKRLHAAEAPAQSPA